MPEATMFQLEVAELAEVAKLAELEVHVNERRKLGVQVLAPTSALQTLLSNYTQLRKEQCHCKSRKVSDFVFISLDKNQETFGTRNLTGRGCRRSLTGLDLDPNYQEPPLQDA